MMIALYILLALVLALCIIYVISTKGRHSHRGVDALMGWKYAHRGLHNEARPENSLAAFRAARDHGYGVELDVHLIADGSLAVMHDSDMLRVTGQAGKIEDLTAGDLPNYHLSGTGETIPLFSQVLELYQGKAPLIVELKVANGNYAALTEAACRMLDDYNGTWCLESFDPRCLLWLKKNRPDVVRGQLSENYLARKSKLSFPIKWMLTTQASSIVTQPDFIAYRYPDRKTLGNFLARKLWKMPGVSWTLETRQQYDTAVQEGWIPIFENFEP